MESLLKVDSLSYRYPQSTEQVLENVSFHLAPEKTLGIIGPNGGGKSTLLKLIAGLLKPSNGKISFHQDFKKEKNRPKISYLPQRDGLPLNLPITIKEWLETARLPFDKVEREEIKGALEKVGLDKGADHPLAKLSGGEYQRVGLARAYLSQSQLILMDEPTKGLDGQGQDRLLLLIKELQKENKASVILIDHNIHQVLKHCDRLLCLNKTFHWHDHTHELNHSILEQTYHCEWEHILIHERGGDILQHKHEHCHQDHKKEES